MAQRQLNHQGLHTVFFFACFVCATGATVLQSKQWNTPLSQCEMFVFSGFFFFTKKTGEIKCNQGSFSLSGKVFPHSSNTNPQGAAWNHEEWRMEYLVVIDLRRRWCRFPRDSHGGKKKKLFFQSLYFGSVDIHLQECSVDGVKSKDLHVRLHDTSD